MKHYTLLELNQSIKRLIGSIRQEFYIVAEIAQINVRNHIYLDLVQKTDNQIVAKSKAMIWEDTAFQLQQKTNQNLWAILKQGNKILMKVTLNFHELYGISLYITDVNVEYSLGELEQNKKETIRLLEENGLMFKQKQLLFPIVPQNIAVISSADAAGYLDFKHQIENNPYRYNFKITLLPSLVQGEKALQELVSRISSVDEASYDVVVLIRGGGASLDLQVFNEYGIAEAIARCPIPILTGIGHQKDETIADLIAYQDFKTPTAVADFLIDSFVAYHQAVLYAHQQIRQQAAYQVMEKKNQLLAQKFEISQTTTRLFEQMRYKVSEKYQHIRQLANFSIKDKQMLLISTQKQIELLNPLQVLARGFSITKVNGKNINYQSIKKGDTITTYTFDYTIKSVVAEATPNTFPK